MIMKPEPEPEPEPRLRKSTEPSRSFPVGRGRSRGRGRGRARSPKRKIHSTCVHTREAELGNKLPTNAHQFDDADVRLDDSEREESGNSSDKEWDPEKFEELVTETYMGRSSLPLQIPFIKPDKRKRNKRRPFLKPLVNKSGVEEFELPPIGSPTKTKGVDRTYLVPSIESIEFLPDDTTEDEDSENENRSRIDVCRPSKEGGPYMDADDDSEDDNKTEADKNSAAVRNWMADADFMEEIDKHLNTPDVDVECDQTFEIVTKPFLRHVDLGRHTPGKIPLKCDHTLENSKMEWLEEFQRTTDYHMKYIQARNQLERKMWIEDYIAGRPVLTSDTINDSYLTSELFAMYGKMDANSKQFKLLFRTHEELVSDDIQEWEKEAKAILVNPNWTPGPHPIPEPEQSNYTILTHFPTTEFEGVESTKLLDEVNPIRNTKVGFVHMLHLPREKKIVKPGTFDSSHNVKTSDTEEKLDCHEKDKDLNITKNIKSDQSDNRENSTVIALDKILMKLGGKFLEVVEKGKSTPTSDLPIEEFNRLRSWICPESVGIKLRYSLEKNMKPYHYGICEEAYMKNFKKKEGYVPSMAHLNFENERSMFLSLPQIFRIWPNHSDGIPKHFNTTGYNPDTIFLPSYLEGMVCDQVTFLWRIWHFYLIVLERRLNSIIRLEELANECYTQFGFKFNCLNWGFKSVKEFCEYLNWRFPRSDVSIVSATADSGVKFMCLFRYSEDEKSKKIENSEDESEIPSSPKLHQPQNVEEPAKPSHGISDLYVGPDDSVPSFEEKCFKGKTLRCTLSHLYSAHQFYVTLNSYRSLRNSLAVRIEEFITCLEECNNPKALNINLELVKPLGHYLFGLHNRQWFRVMTIYRDKIDNEFMKVFLIDVGCFTNIRVKDLRYMPQIFTTLQAQAIPCRLRFPSQLTRYFSPPRWDAAWLANMDRFFFGSDMEIKFIKFTNQENNPIWEVDARKSKGLRGDIRLIYDIPYRLAKSRPRRSPELGETYTIGTDKCLQDSAIPKSYGCANVVDKLMVMPVMKNGEFCLKLDEESDKDDSEPDPFVSDCHDLVIPTCSEPNTL